VNCAVQLGDIFCLIFQLSLQLHRVPRLCKDSIIVPVPKIQTPKTLNEFRPVALAYLVMKAFERLVKDALLDTVQKWAIGTLLNVFFFKTS